MSLPVVVGGRAEGGLLAQAYLTQFRPFLQINPSFPPSNCKDLASSLVLWSQKSNME